MIESHTADVRIGDPTTAEQAEFERRISDAVKHGMANDLGRITPHSISSPAVDHFVTGLTVKANGISTASKAVQDMIDRSVAVANAFRQQKDGRRLEFIHRKSEAENLKEGCQCLALVIEFYGSNSQLQELGPVNASVVAAILAEDWSVAHSNYKRTFDPKYFLILDEVEYDLKAK